jgi:hypothetical protein
MAASAPERRSYQLEKIRTGLREQLNKCSVNKKRDSFKITHEAQILLTEPEERAMFRQLDASHGEVFKLELAFTPIRRGRPTKRVTSIQVTAIRWKRLQKRAPS